MRLAARAFLLGVLLEAVAAECPNACNGHGTCSSKDQCQCDPGYKGNDCALRSCQYELAWVDTPRGDLNHDGALTLADGLGASNAGGLSKVQWSASLEYEIFPSSVTANNGINSDPISAANNEAHFYAECSNRGSCNTDSGECECQPGYTGSACQRASCPNDCNGKGLCYTVREVAALRLNKFQVAGLGGQKIMAGVQTGFDYNRWDADKATMCVCDPGFTGPDCSQRMCPRNDDPLTWDKRYCGGTTCTWEIQSFTLSDSPLTTYRIGFTDSFNGTYFAYVPLDVSADPNGFVAASLVATQKPGPTTSAGKLAAALRALPTGALHRVEVYPAGDSTATPAADSTRTFRVTFVGVGGNQAALTIEAVTGSGGLWYNPDHASYNAAYPTEASRVVVTTAEGNYEEIECSGRGNCDTDSGTCACFKGYSGEACQNQNSLAM